MLPTGAAYRNCHVTTVVGFEAEAVCSEHVIEEARREAVRLDPDNSSAYVSLGWALHAREDYQAAVDAFVAAPSDATLEAAKTAWRAARVPYQQTEVYRFGNRIVDDWEGRVNAWPLDEGLIDFGKALGLKVIQEA